MEGKCHQSRSRSISQAKNSKTKPRDENRFSFEKKRQQNGRQQRGSIMRKQKKLEEVKHHQLNKDDMQLTIENIMLLSGHGQQCIFAELEIKWGDYNIVSCPTK